MKRTGIAVTLAISIAVSIAFITFALQQIRINTISKKLELVEQERRQYQKKIDRLEEKVFLLESGNRILRSNLEALNQK